MKRIRFTSTGKLICFFLAFFCLASVSRSQHINQPDVKNPKNQNTKNPNTKNPNNTKQPVTNNVNSAPRRDSSYSFIDIGEKLVQLALQNPEYEIADRQVNKSVYQLKKAKGEWLSPISVSGNLNEFSIKPVQNQPNFFPRYNIGVTIPFDLFTSKQNDVKIARENLLISEAERNQRYRQIRADVLTAYEDYLMNKDKVQLYARLMQDQYTILLSKEKDFQDAIISQEEYNKFSSAYLQQQFQAAEYQRNLNVSKILLERMIGRPIDQVLGIK